MSEFSLKDLLLMAFGGGGLLALVAIGKAVFERVDQARKNKKELTDTHTTLSVRNRELDLQEDERQWAQLYQIIDTKDREITKLIAECETLKSSNSLSNPTISTIYAAFRKLGREISRLDSMIIKELTHPKLAEQMEQVKAHFDQLEKSLP
jgi:capsule polysaccharide export protein KpsE/RkpR